MAWFGIDEHVWWPEVPADCQPAPHRARLFPRKIRACHQQGRCSGFMFNTQTTSLAGTVQGPYDRPHKTGAVLTVCLALDCCRKEHIFRAFPLVDSQTYSCQLHPRRGGAQMLNDTIICLHCLETLLRYYCRCLGHVGPCPLNQYLSPLRFPLSAGFLFAAVSNIKEYLLV